MSFRAIVRALRRSWWIIAISLLVALGAGIGIIVATTPTYASTVTFFVRTPSDQLGGAYQGDQFAQKRVNSYVQLAESRRLADLVKEDTQLPLSADEITRMVSARGDVNTVLLSISAIDTSAQRSLDVARSISTQFVRLVAELETPPGAEAPTVSLEVTSEATLDPEPVAPRKSLILALAAVLGILLGAAVVALREVLDQTLKSTEEITRLTATPTLAVVPFDQSARQSPLVVNADAGSLRAEALRQLRTNLQFVDVDRPASVLVVTSSLPGEGKTSTATNLAVMFAEAGQKVLLIEADLRRPRVAEYLGLEGAVGLTNVLAGQVELSDVLQPWGRGGLTLLPSGSVPPNPSELLGSQNMTELLNGLKRIFDIIVIDTPPLLPVTDGAIAAAKADGAILVVRYGKTTEHQLAQAKASLDAVGARLLGTVLNMSPARDKTYGYGSYGNIASSAGIERTADSTERSSADPDNAQAADHAAGSSR